MYMLFGRYLTRRIRADGTAVRVAASLKKPCRLVCLGPKALELLHSLNPLVKPDLAISQRSLLY
jgi:hypothetical protein